MLSFFNDKTKSSLGEKCCFQKPLCESCAAVQNSFSFDPRSIVPLKRKTKEKMEASTKKSFHCHDIIKIRRHLSAFHSFFKRTAGSTSPIRPLQSLPKNVNKEGMLFLFIYSPPKGVTICCFRRLLFSLCLYIRRKAMIVLSKILLLAIH